MTRTLRARHRWAWIGLAVLLPILLAAAFHARRPAAVMDRLPAALGTEVQP